MKNESFLKEFMENKTLASKLIRVIIAFVIIPVVLLGAVSLFQFNSIRKSNFETSVNSLNQVVENYINEKFQLPLDMFNYVEQTNTLNNSIQSEADVLNVYKTFVDTNNDIVAAFYYSIDTNRTTIYPVIEIPSDLDTTTREWYQKAIENNGGLAVSNVYEDALTGNKMVTISKAVIKDGQVKGVFGADFNLNSIVEAVSQIKYGKDGIVALVDNQGIIVAHSNIEAVGHNIADYCADWEKIQSANDIIMNTKMDDLKLRIGVKTSELTGFKTILFLPSKTYNNILLVNVISLLIISILVMWLAIYIGTKYAQGIKRKIDNVKEGILKASLGDFSKDVVVESQDELGLLAESYNQMRKSIANLINEVTNSVATISSHAENLTNNSEEVSAAIEEVAQTMSEISKGTESSAENVNILSDNINNISSKLDNVKESTESMNLAAQKANELSKQGVELIRDVILSSQETQTSSEEVNAVVLDVSNNVTNIAVMNETISKITEQTNLLALNAAIEAARAGESGRGFAVVADQIRNLADETAKSAKEIDNVVKSMSIKTNEAVEKVSKTNEIVEKQTKSVLEARKVFTEIILSVEDLTNRLENIAERINEVNQNKNEILSEVVSVASIGEETAAGAEEVTASCEEVSAAVEEFVSFASNLKDLSKSLRNEVNKFTT